MRKFGLRLFLIRKLIESLTWSCIDEYTEFEEIADGLGRTLWAMDRKMRPDPVDAEIRKRMEALSKTGKCGKAAELLGISGDDFCVGCHQIRKKSRPDYWSCLDEQKSARRWLAEHGIKE